MLGIREIAKKAGVSVATVSRCLDPEKRELVREETRKKVNAVIKSLNYIPNRAARILSKNKTETIGMVTTFSSDIVLSPYFQRLISGIIEGIKETSYDLKWILIRDEDQEGITLKSIVDQYLVDGIILLNWNLFPKVVQNIGGSSHIPAVLINDYHNKINTHIVYADQKHGVEELLKHFKKKGYHKIGMIRGPEYVSYDAKARYQFFKTLAKKMNFKLDNNFNINSSRFEVEAAYHSVLSQWNTQKKPDVFFGANDDIARGVIKALKHLKIKVPEDIAVVGFDGSQLKEADWCEVTTIEQPLEKMGEKAVRVLIEVMDNSVKVIQRIKFDPKLVIGKSG